MFSKTKRHLLLSAFLLIVFQSPAKADQNLSTVAIYQLENARDHLYSADPETNTEDADGAYRNRSEDEAFDLLKFPEPGAVLLYSCKAAEGQHFLSKDAECGDAENSTEETLGYIQTKPSQTLQYPLYRCSPLLGDIFSTDEEDCVNSPGGLKTKHKIFGYVDVPASKLPPSIPRNPGYLQKVKP